MIQETGGTVADQCDDVVLEWQSPHERTRTESSPLEPSCAWIVWVESVLRFASGRPDRTAPRTRTSAPRAIPAHFNELAVFMGPPASREVQITTMNDSKVRSGGVPVVRTDRIGPLIPVL